MCGIFGFSSYAEEAPKNVNTLTEALAVESAIRGTDATGIAYVHGNGITVNKYAKSAYQVDFKLPANVHSLIGHTRHATHGTPKRSCNNHPFFGMAGRDKFALAHNGIIDNVEELRKKYHIPKTKVETDSYIAVQLLQTKKRLDEAALKYMAENVSGSFSFCLLDQKQNLYLVKGDSPLSILHFPKQKLFAFASTEEILWKSIVETSAFSALKSGAYESIDILPGQILKITPKGEVTMSDFEYTDYSMCGYMRWYDYSFPLANEKDEQDEYLRMLKQLADQEGMGADTVDELVQSGFSYEEIENIIYENGW